MIDVRHRPAGLDRQRASEAVDLRDVFQTDV